MDDDFCYITLRCHDCSSIDCPICPLGIYIPEDSNRGCTRKIPDVIYAQYKHLNNEILPFCDTYEKRENCLNKIAYLESNIIYSSIGQILDDKGKVLISNKLKHIIKEYNSKLTNHKIINCQ